METAHSIAVGAVSLIHAVEPAGIFLGGGMTFGGPAADLGRRFLDHVRREVRRLALPALAAKTTIDFASLGGDAGYIGAAGVARLEHLQQGR